MSKSSSRFVLLSLLALLAVALLSACSTWAQQQQHEGEQKSGATEDSATPHVLVHKSVPQSEAIVERNLTFSITVYNAGKRPIYDVAVEDEDAVLEGILDVAGSNKAHFDVIEPAAHTTHSYSVTPKVLGAEIVTTPAKVSFRTSADQQQKDTVKSTDLPAIPVLTASQFNKKHNSHFDEWAIFSLLFATATGLPYLVYIYSNNKIEELRH